VSPWSSTNSGDRSPKLGPQSISLTWTLLSISIALLLGQAVIGFVVGRNGLADLGLAIATALLVASAVLNARATGILVERRHSEAESFGRLLQALSRSVSPNAVIEAIVNELGSATRADHVAVVQMQPGGTVLDVSFVSMAPGSQASNTVMPIRQLEPVETRRLRTGPRLASDPTLRVGASGRAEDAPEAAAARGKSLAWEAKDERRDPSGRPRSRSRRPELDPALNGSADNARDMAEQIAYWLRDAYGLRNTLAAPLIDGEAIVGAIVLSRRTGEPWTDSSVRLLNSAAGETTAALKRVYSHQAAEVAARTDQLTHLPNRRYFDEYCTLIASRRRASDRVAILAVDVDHFKRLNDMYGHQTGDEVLRAIGNAIQTSVREEDVPARYGGEEFMVLLRNPNHGVAMEIGERIRTTVRELELIEAGVTDRVTVSIGVASGLAADEPIAEIVERADRALYAAKRTGRDRVIEAWPSDV
jgi:diguanylate cyclase (GGDEF)-like protein